MTTSPDPAIEGQLELPRPKTINYYYPNSQTKLCDLKLHYVSPYVPAHPYKNLTAGHLIKYLLIVTSFFMKRKNILKSVELFPDYIYRTSKPARAGWLSLFRTPLNC